MTVLTSLRVLLATNRPVVRAFFEDQRQQSLLPSIFVHLSMDDTSLVEFSAEVDRANVALVDVAADPDAAQQLYATLRARRPDLRILAIVCCPRPTVAWHVQELVASGVSEILDVQIAADAVLGTYAAGEDDPAAIRVHVHDGGVPLSAAVLQLPTRDDRWLLERVARGWTDDELAAERQVSARTVRTRLERLKRELGVNSREELAAWAGAQGLYDPTLLQPATVSLN